MASCVCSSVRLLPAIRASKICKEMQSYQLKMDLKIEGGTGLRKSSMNLHLLDVCCLWRRCDSSSQPSDTSRLSSSTHVHSQCSRLRAPLLKARAIVQTFYVLPSSRERH